MAARTVLSKNCLKSSSFIQIIPKSTVLNNKTVHVTGCQAARQATTSSIADNLTIAKPRLLSPSVLSRLAQKSAKPATLVNFTSTEGKRLFRGAMVQGHAESFFKLMGNFSNQSSPSYGGVSTLAMVLNALEIDPKRTWKGNWRWFSSEQMKTCSPAELIQERGIPFDEFICLAQTHCKVEPHRGVSYQQFLTDVGNVTSDATKQMVVNYSRAILGQRGEIGNFSPIGGYNRKENQILIMDVALGKYPSVWVDAKDLYRAMMATSLEENGRSRGYFVLSGYDEQTRALLDKAALMSSMRLTCKECSRNCHSRA
ncbi:Phytochelatin synthase-domain-containing protein [Mycotypha africana]|uniref:Phytochelatin synthase-domain-containing protein n=1 Tax=Mycotypha africana TaxID=64632 RepID=UPI00230029FD|nr:Phytochelatin synthase-domain-containing protein [Mycotypha africana]KAI8977172.1 Phytochelatin synthase-domain-containing protein [Mycotypha africana]